MMSKITAFSIVCMVALGIFLGFSISDNPFGSKSNTSSSDVPNINPPVTDAAYYTDDFNGTNDTTALKARGYKVYYRGGGAQGAAATWFQGNSTVFSAYEGPATGYVACNYQVVNGTNNIDSWLVLPRLNVASGDTIAFWNRSTDPGTVIYPDSFRVMYSAAGDSTPEGASWVELGRFRAPNGPWERKSYRVSSAGANARFAIRYNVVNGGPNGANSDYSGLDYLTVSAGGGTTCSYSWVAQTSGTPNQLLTVSAVSDMIGWAAGVGPTVVRTTNGGLTWTNATGTGIGASEGIYNIYAWSATDALCTTSPGATNIYKTTNGGTTWTNVFTAPSPAFIDGIHMISPTEGYALGDPVTAKWMVLKTTNGGVNWARMATEPSQVGSEAGWNNSFLIVGTHMWFGTNATRVYHSTDLGLTWTSGATTGSINTYNLHFNNTSNGLAGGNAMVKSTDGGTTYTAVTNPGTAGNINGIEGNGTDWWAIRSSAVIYRSTDAGASWTTAHTQTGAVFQDIDFAIVGGCPYGWAVGNAGVIVKMPSTSGVTNYNTEIPSAFELSQNYPNPFNPTTNIKFSIPQSGLTVLKVYDIVGKEVATLLNEVKTAGNYIVDFDASGLPSGTYFYRLEMNNLTESKKMVLIK